MAINVKSKIDVREGVENKQRMFGSAQKYFPAIVVTPAGDEVPALFTEDQIRIAKERGKKNVEDFPTKKGGLFSFLF